MTTPFILIDGSSYFFRAFHALPPLTNSEGQPTGAVYGVVNMIRKLIKQHQPQYFAIIFDAPGKTFRHDIYPEYKANRPPMPDELRQQFKPLVETLGALGYPVLSIDGVEADDVIGTLTIQAIEMNLSVLISTGDKDLAQLVSPKVSLVNTMSKKTLDEQGVYEKFGVYPNQMIDYLTLVGDSSDNIPGVPQCGPKTAAKWLKTYDSLDNLLTHAGEIKGKIGERLNHSLSFLHQSKQLVTLKTDVALPVQVTQLTQSEPNKAKLLTLARRLEANVWLKEWESQTQTNHQQGQSSKKNSLIGQMPHPPLIIQTQQQWSDYLAELEQSTVLCIDTETTSLCPIQAKLVGIALMSDTAPCAYIPLAHVDQNQAFSLDEFLSQLKPFLERANLPKLGQNLKYDFNVFKKYHITLTPIIYDTMVESYLLNSTATRHNMDALAKYYLNYETIPYEAVAGRGKNQLCFDQVPVAQAAPYAIEDVWITHKLHEHLYPKLPKSIESLLQEIEMPLIPILANMEYRGVLIDTQVLSAQGKALRIRTDALEKKAYQLAGKHFNLNSTKQLQTILYDELNCPIIAKTPKGQPSTAESVLQVLAYDHELPEIILAYRSLSKLLSTYIEALPNAVHPLTGRVHTSFNQAVTATGRLSSSDPNLQNIPIRTPEGRAIRQAFIAPKSCVLLAADYSQIELRIMAHLSKDKGLIDAFHHNLDIHKATASEVFGITLDRVTEQQRRHAKAINFGLIYGMSSFGLSKQMGVSTNAAKAYIDLYFKKYPGVLEYMNTIRESAKEQGYVETIYGRRLYLNDINSSVSARKKAAERTAINAPMQGTAADIIKMAMIHIDKVLSEQSELGIQLIMQVHDELVFEVPKAHIDMAQNIIQAGMEQAAELLVPLKVSIGIGQNWDDAH